jgi:hypothetical protein
MKDIYWNCNSEIKLWKLLDVQTILYSEITSSHIRLDEQEIIYHTHHSCRQHSILGIKFSKHTALFVHTSSRWSCIIFLSKLAILKKCEHTHIRMQKIYAHHSCRQQCIVGTKYSKHHHSSYIHVVDDLAVYFSTGNTGEIWAHTYTHAHDRKFKPTGIQD